jgi:hypothetical protein
LPIGAAGVLPCAECRLEAVHGFYLRFNASRETMARKRRPAAPLEVAKAL